MPSPQALSLSLTSNTLSPSARDLLHLNDLHPFPLPAYCLSCWLLYYIISQSPSNWHVRRKPSCPCSSVTTPAPHLFKTARPMTIYRLPWLPLGLTETQWAKPLFASDPHLWLLHLAVLPSRPLGKPHIHYPWSHPTLAVLLENNIPVAQMTTDIKRDHKHGESPSCFPLIVLCLLN